MAFNSDGNHFGEVRDQAISYAMGEDEEAEAQQGITAEQDLIDRERQNWVSMAREYHQSSTDYLDSSIRAQWSKNLAHFRNQHADGSKYKTDAYKNRSQIFRPKTRSVVRGQEAALAAAMFSNQDVADVRAQNQNDPQQEAGARVAKSLLRYRLENTIPWFLTVQGAFQDTQNYGVCVSKQFWQYEAREEVSYEPAVDPMTGGYMMDEEGQILGEEIVTQSVEKDRPWIDLLAPENFRFDPNCDWRDAVADSPYLIEQIPMYASEVLEMMGGEGNAKTGEASWFKYDLGTILASGRDTAENAATRQAREGDRRTDPVDVESGNEFSTVWVHFNIIRYKGEDLAFYTLGTQRLLTDPVPLREHYPLGRATYRVGFSVVEAHRNYPAGNNELASSLQEEVNDITNQRLDNVKLALNKRYFMRRGARMDFAAVMRNVPGGGVVTDDPDRDVRVIETNDVTASSFNEQDRLSVEMDDLMGTFSTSSVQSNRALNETVGGMNMISDSANQVQEYTLRIFVETWVEPVLRSLVKLEQKFETDEVVLALAAQNSQLLQRYGVNQVTDDLLDQELIVNVNVGMGNTSPSQKIERINVGIQTVAQLPSMASRLNEEEISKEVFGALGFGDGDRFLIPVDQVQPQGDPMADIEMQKLQLMQQKQEQELALKQQELEIKRDVEFGKLALQERIKLSEMYDRLGIERERIKTSRDIAALQQSTKTRELNMKEKFGTGI